MFMCEKCHEKDKNCNWPMFLHMQSYGRCEICGKTEGCADCKAYKYAAPKPKKKEAKK
jgi:hypothetical protein